MEPLSHILRHTERHTVQSIVGSVERKTRVGPPSPVRRHWTQPKRVRTMAAASSEAVVAKYAALRKALRKEDYDKALKLADERTCRVAATDNTRTAAQPHHTTHAAPSNPTQ